MTSVNLRISSAASLQFCCVGFLTGSVIRIECYGVLL